MYYQYSHREVGFFQKSPFVALFLFVSFALNKLSLSLFSVRRRHSEREEEAVHEEATGGRETEDPPGQRTQVHVYLPPSTHLLFPLQRVHLVRVPAVCTYSICVWTVNWISPCLFLLIGVYLESRAISAKVSRHYVLLLPQLKHTSIPEAPFV